MLSVVLSFFRFKEDRTIENRDFSQKLMSINQILDI